MPTIRKAQIQFAAGTSFLGGRAHFEVSGEFTSEAGINSLDGARKWWQNPQQLQMFSTAQCQPNGCPGGSPQWINGLNGANVLWAYGGLITRGPLQGTQFGANGVPSQFDYGYGYNGLPATACATDRLVRDRYGTGNWLLVRRLLPRRRSGRRPGPATIRSWRAWCAATPICACPMI